jgi:hypothetical protein
VQARPLARTPDDHVATACPGRGLVLEESDGNTHAHVGASTACWGIFGGWSGGPGLHPVVGGFRQLVVDGYMVQHPDIPERRAIRSVGIHLMSLCFRLEGGVAAEHAAAMIGRLLARRPAFRWLEPPIPNGTLTIADVVAAGRVGVDAAHDTSMAPEAAGPDAADVAERYGRGVWERGGRTTPRSGPGRTRPGSGAVSGRASPAPSAEPWRRRADERPHMLDHGFGSRTVRWPRPWAEALWTVETPGRHPALHARDVGGRAVAELVPSAGDEA